MIKIAHSVVITPGRCGLYETTRDLVKSIRGDGFDARMVDPTKDKNKLHPDGDEDRGAPISDMDFAKSADVLLNHSGLGEELENTNQPVIHVAHGRPRVSFLSENKGSTPIFSYHYKKNRDTRFKCLITFWPEHKPYHEVMWPDTPVHVITAPVDLDKWTPEGPSGYGFHGHSGSVNVVCADAWREDVDPFVAVHAFALFARRHKGAKLHMYGRNKNMKGWGALIKTLQDENTMGELLPWVSGLENVYRAADMVITPHHIAVRSMREAMACGCPVVSPSSGDLYKFVDSMEEALPIDRNVVRKDAENLFNPTKTAEEFKAIVRKVIVTHG